MGLTDNWHMAKISKIKLTTDICLGLYWQLTKDLIVLYFLQNPFLGPFNSTVLLFSSENGIKCSSIWVILPGARLSVIFRLWFTVTFMCFMYHPLSVTYDLKFMLLWAPDEWRGVGGYSWEFLVWVCRSNLQILTLFHTKKCHFSHPFSDLASKIHTRF